MKKEYFNIIIGISVILIIYGFIEGTTGFSIFKATNNHETMTAIFSLAGVFLFFAALVYQIKEYENQLNEVKKSVEAQTKSSEAQIESSKALKAQIELNKKQLDLNRKQLNDELTLKFMDSFTNYYKDNNEREILHAFFKRFILKLKQNIVNNSKGINSAIRTKIIENTLNDVSNSNAGMRNVLEHFFMFSSNTLRSIYKFQDNSPNIQLFTSDFLNRLSRRESMMLKLCPLIEFDSFIIIDQNYRQLFTFSNNNIKHFKTLYESYFTDSKPDQITTANEQLLLEQLNERIEKKIHTN